MRKTAITAVLAAAGLSLVACGGTTVDSDDVTTAPAPASSSATSAPTTTSSAESSSAAPRESSETNDALANEGAASEVSDFPENAPKRPKEDEAYLEALREGGVDVEGNEEQLLSTARTLCGGEEITRDAVAGQLIEQQRTSLDHEKLSQLIDDAAHSHLC